MFALTGQRAEGKGQDTLILAALCVLVGIVTYASSVSGPLVFDDQSAILNNPQIRQLWPPIDALAPPRNSVLASRPIVNLSFAINYALGGLSVRGYHLVNITLHIVCALLLFGIVHLTLTGPKLRDRFHASANGIALACALVWMVHPLQTEAVSYLTQRTEVMMGLFYLLTLYCAIRALGSSVPERWHLAAIVSCLIGVGCKESIVTAPIMVVLYDRIFAFDSLREAVRTRRTLYLGLALSWLELAAVVSSRAGTVGFSAGISAWTYLLNQAHIVARYLQLTVWPHALVIDYGVPRLLTLPDVLPRAALIVALLVATGLLLARIPMLGFLAAWFFITLAPTSSIVPIVSEVGAERRMYLPLAGLVVLAVIGVYRLAGARTARYIVAVLVAALAFGTVQRNRDYASPVTLLQTSLDRWPQGRAHFNLAVALKAQGKADDAMTHLRLAVVDDPQAQYVLGSELYDRGQFDQAIAELRAFIARPLVSRNDVIKAHNLLALALAQQGELTAAAEELQQALQMDPDNPDLHGNLAFVLLQDKRFDGARQHYETYLKAREANAFILTNLGLALEGLGQREEAAVRYRQALALDPAYQPARSRLVGATP